MGVVDDLLAAREVYERGEWVAAYEALSGLDKTGKDDAATWRAKTLYALRRPLT